MSNKSSDGWDPLEELRNLIRREGRPGPGPLQRGQPIAARLDLLDSNPVWHRQDLNQEVVERLAWLISRLGFCELILVRRAGSRYQVIVGHRRVAAVRLLRDQAKTEAERRRWEMVPALDIPDVSDQEMLDYTLIENLVRRQPTINRAEALDILRRCGFVRVVAPSAPISFPMPTPKGAFRN